MKSADPVSGPAGRNQFQFKPIGIVKHQGIRTEALLDPAIRKTRRPAFQTRDIERDRSCLSGSVPAPRRVRPGEEGEYASGFAGLVAEVEVVRARVIEIHGE